MNYLMWIRSIEVKDVKATFLEIDYIELLK